MVEITVSELKRRISAALWCEWLAAALDSGAVGSVWPQALRYELSLPPHVGTPGAGNHGGNSTPARALVAGARKSPVFGPVSGE